VCKNNILLSLAGGPFFFKFTANLLFIVMCDSALWGFVGSSSSARRLRGVAVASMVKRMPLVLYGTSLCYDLRATCHGRSHQQAPEAVRNKVARPSAIITLCFGGTLFFL
jgi:hypothetical protein